MQWWNWDLGQAKNWCTCSLHNCNLQHRRNLTKIQKAACVLSFCRKGKKRCKSEVNYSSWPAVAPIEIWVLVLSLNIVCLVRSVNFQINKCEQLEFAIRNHRKNLSLKREFKFWCYIFSQYNPIHQIVLKIICVCWEHPKDPGWTLRCTNCAFGDQLISSN